MRLKPVEQEAIRHSVAEVFGSGTLVRLFGSRADDRQRGGDIDLYVETRLPVDERERRRFRLLARLQRRLGEQKIDLVLANPDDPQDVDRPIARVARREGIPL
jgi:predicted nucleotidyltransferase